MATEALEVNMELREEISDERGEALSEYNRLMVPVIVLRDMTDTEEWQRLWKWLFIQEALHKELWVDEDNTRKMTVHQETVRVIRRIKDHVSGPVRELNRLIDRCPLFAQDMKRKAKWDEATGTVEIVDIE